MKIKTRKMDYDKVLALPKAKHRNPLRPNFVLSTVVRVAAILDLLPTHFQYRTHGMEKIQGQPCLILMNHSSFIDLKIVSKSSTPSPMASFAPATVLSARNGSCACWAVSPPKNLSAT